MRKVAIVGVGLTKWGVRQATYKELVQEAGKALFDDVEGLDKKDVDSLFVGSALVDRLAFQAYPAPLVAEQLGIEGPIRLSRSVRQSDIDSKPTNTSPRDGIIRSQGE